ncbi:MAG: dephospho-CoA kinase [Micromonosporaceae bacterium]|nr:dephospho-CoA kinase [Micromonosporaceae bacterium]
MLKVGLTGGIGAGKSAVAARLAHLGATVVDADVLAREVVAPGSEGLAEIVAEFGDEVLAPDGSLDRPALAATVFGDDAARRRLEQVIHPRVRRATAGRIADAPPDAIVVNDVPLLVETGLAPTFDLVIVVEAPEGARIERLLRGRGMTREQAAGRIAAQASAEQRRAAADVVLDNSGDLDALHDQVDALWKNRLAPYEENLRTGRRAPRQQEAVLVEPDPTWPTQAKRLIDRLTAAVGERVVRIDHVGSTSVPGLIAKDLIDIQVVTRDLDEAERLTEDASRAGLVPVPGQWFDLDRHGQRHEKRVAVDADPGRPVNALVQPWESPVWRDILLFRDWLRADADGRAGYASLKWSLAARSADVDQYSDDKMPWINAALERAEEWARRTGWRPPDA